MRRFSAATEPVWSVSTLEVAKTWELQHAWGWERWLLYFWSGLILAASWWGKNVQLYLSLSVVQQWERLLLSSMAKDPPLWSRSLGINVDFHHMADTNILQLSSLFLDVSWHLRYANFIRNSSYVNILHIFGLTMLLEILNWALEPSQCYFGFGLAIYVCFIVGW